MIRKLSPNFIVTAACLAAVAMAPAACSAQVQQDKVKHAVVSAALGAAAAEAIGAGAGPAVCREYPKSCAWGAAMLPGLAKEISDSRPGGTGFDGKDMLANAAGALIGVHLHGFAVQRRGRTTLFTYTTSF